MLCSFLFLRFAMSCARKDSSNNERNFHNFESKSQLRACCGLKYRKKTPAYLAILATNSLKRERSFPCPIFCSSTLSLTSMLCFNNHSCDYKWCLILSSSFSFWPISMLETSQVLVFHTRIFLKMSLVDSTGKPVSFWSATFSISTFYLLAKVE